jgi:hypothetical protein
MQKAVAGRLVTVEKRGDRTDVYRDRNRESKTGWVEGEGV